MYPKTLTLSSVGQITLPKSIRDILGLSSGDKVKMQVNQKAGTITLKKQPTTQDNPDEVKKAEKLIENKRSIYILEDAAMMEVVYVLTGDFYHFSRQEVAESIKTVMAIDNIYCNKSVISGALDMYVSHPKLSFIDCYLAIMTDTSCEVPLWTLDKKLASQAPVAKLVA